MNLALLQRMPVWGVDSVAIIACAAIGAAAYFSVVEPRRAAAAAVESADQQAQELEATLRQTHAQAAARQRRTQRLSDQLRSAVVLEPVSRLNDRLTRVAVLAEKVSATPRDGAPPLLLKVDQVSPLAPVKTERFYTVPIRVAGTATYASASELIARLHQAFPDIQIVGLKLTVIESGEEAGTRAAAGNPKESGKDDAQRAPAQPPGPSATRAAFALDLVWYAALESKADSAGSAPEKKQE